MSNRSLILILAAVLAAFLYPSAAAPAYAPAYALTDPPGDAADQERVEQEVAEAAALLENATERAQRAAARYAAANAALPAAQARVDEVRGEVIAAEVRAETAEREAEQAQQELTAAAGRFDASVTAVEDARTQVSAFAVAAYKGSPVATFNLLIQARDPAELIERLGYVDHAGSAKRAALDELSGARLHARQAENEATLAHDRAEQHRRATAVAAAQAQAAHAAAELAATEAAVLAETRAEALAEAEAEREESLRRYEQAEAEAARVEAELREWEANQRAAAPPPGRPAPPPRAPGTGSGALLTMPTQGWMSSPYGMRHDPFFNVWQLHAGVDIAAPGGTPIYAAADGTVIRAGWNGGYGNFTCLGHGAHQGSGLSTCYAHQSEILVADGQWVRRGDLIGRVGTTGASTGNHLHFEVRLDGSPTDPVPFLPGF